jgi:uncharacterized protein with HEPN domain
MKDERLYLIHILECIEKIESYTADGHARFMEDFKGQDAVLRNLQILAESAKRRSPARLARHPEVNWRGLIGLRNVLVHDYLGVKLERIWAIVQQHLPPLKKAVQQMLDQSPNPSS